MQNKDERIPGETIYEYYDEKGNLLYTDVTRGTSLRTLMEVGNGMVQGDFHTPNPFSFGRWHRDFTTGENILWKGDFPKQIIKGLLGIEVVPQPPSYDEPYNRALDSINEKVRGSLDWSVNAAQASQTASMVANAMKTLNYVRRAVTKGDLAPLYAAYRRWIREPMSPEKKFLRDMGSRWLEFQYGWKPFAQDLYNTAVEMGRDFPSLMVCEARETKLERFTTFSNLYGCPSQTSYETSSRVLMKVRMRPNTSTIGLLSNFTSLNPASIAWELTPFSFVVDWFYDVGGYMRNLESSLLSAPYFQDGFITYSSRCQADYFVSGDRVPEGGGSDQYRTIHAKGTSVDTRLNRVKLVDYPFPRLPTFKADLGSGRLMNAAALISQALR